MQSIINFSYANPSNDLSELTRECDSHRDICKEYLSIYDFQFYQDSSIAFGGLKKGIKFLGTESIFHFSGHAGDWGIALEDGPVFIDGIAALINKSLVNKELPRLVLVFLNGCSTAALVDKLLAVKVPILIATDEAVNDSIAADFSVDFYTHLFEGKTISQSFEAAVVNLKTRAPKVEITRGEQQQGGGSGTWGIHYSDKHKHLLNWQLTKKVEDEEHSYEVNSIIRAALYQALLLARSSRIVSLHARKLSGEDIDEDLNDDLISSFPSPISNNLQRLLSVGLGDEGGTQDKLLLTHLVNLNGVFHSVSELLFFMILSQLWDVCLDLGADDSAQMPPVDDDRVASLGAIIDFFKTTRRERKDYDYIASAITIGHVMRLPENKNSGEELRSLLAVLDADKKIGSCRTFFEELAGELEQKEYVLESFKVTEKCKEAETHLSYFLSKVTFYADYDFAILRNITLNLPRYRKKPSYMYHLMKIPKKHNGAYKIFAPTMSGFTSVKSVVMLKSSALKPGEYLPSGQVNLYPFVIDFNAYNDRADKGDLIIYSHFDSNTNSFVYEEASGKRERYVTEDNPMYLEILEAMKAILKVIFNQELVALNITRHG